MAKHTLTTLLFLPLVAAFAVGCAGGDDESWQDSANVRGNGPQQHTVGIAQASIEQASISQLGAAAAAGEEMVASATEGPMVATNGDAGLEASLGTVERNDREWNAASPSAAERGDVFANPARGPMAATNGDDDSQDDSTASERGDDDWYATEQDEDERDPR